MDYYGIHGTRLNFGFGNAILSHIGSYKFVQMKSSRTLTESEIAYVCECTLIALQELAEANTIHRDVKAGNLLVSEDGEVKLADFGASGTLTETSTSRSTFAGTLRWMAPEMARNWHDSK